MGGGLLLSAIRSMSIAHSHGLIMGVPADGKI
jgi:hypothetical protein